MPTNGCIDMDGDTNKETSILLPPSQSYIRLYAIKSTYNLLYERGTCLPEDNDRDLFQKNINL